MRDRSGPDDVRAAVGVERDAAWTVEMSSIARKLGLSVRTLRRHLAAEGKLYTDIVNQALGSIAKTCLRYEQRMIVETALELGFSDNTSFHRALKRWTGLTPLEYRREYAGLSVL